MSQQAKPNEVNGWSAEPQLRRLAAFDFDHTIIDENVDITIRDLVDPSLITPEIQLLYKQSGFTAYMQAVFQILHDNGITRDDIFNVVTKIGEVKGMTRLIKELHDMNFDIIIISDANTYFIKNWCAVNGVISYIKRIFSNPAYFNTTGKLEIRPYHHQTECSLSTANLCKGMVLDGFIAEQRENCNVLYTTVFYIGDGQNDVCPALRLSRWDYACARIGYRMERELDQIKRDHDKNNANLKLDATVIHWLEGTDLNTRIREAIRNNPSDDVISVDSKQNNRKTVTLTRLKDSICGAIGSK